jgi:hypothetical protein
MESLRNEPVSINGYGGGYGGSSILDTILAASLIGGNRGYQPAVTDVGTLHTSEGIGDTRRDVLEASSDVRSDIKESECSVKDSVHELQTATTGEFRTVGMKLCDIEKEAVETKWANAVALKDAEYNIVQKVDRESDFIKAKIDTLQVSQDKQFCDLTHQIERKFNDLNTRDMQNTIDELRRANGALASGAANASLITQIQAILAPLLP